MTDAPREATIDGMNKPNTRLGRMADFAYRRRGRVVLAWIAALAAVLAIAPSLAGEFSQEFAMPGTESKAASDLLAERFPGQSGDTVDVVWEAPGGVRSVDARADGFLADAARLEGIAEPQPARVSSDGTIAVTRLELDRRAWDVPDETAERLVSMADRASGDGMRIELGGTLIQRAEGGGSPEAVGFIAAAVILLIAFGSVLAVGLPLVTALFGLAISASLIGVLTAVFDVPEFAPAIAAMIGIGVGIDYALLILTRFRSALARGAQRRDAVVEAVTTAGRSVLIAGTTVVISLFGLFAMDMEFLRGVAVAASLAVLVVMAASVTLLPALLAFAGSRVNSLRIPGLGRTRERALAGRWSRSVQRRPWTAAIAGTAILFALAAPVLGLRLGFPDAGNDRAGTTTRAAYDLISRGFGPGANGPLLVVADDPRDPAALAEGLRSEPDVAFVGEPRVNGSRDAAVITVVPRSSPQDAATTDLVERLRDELPPGVYVGGIAAAFVDQSELVAGRLPVFIAIVLALSFLLLLAAFRSPVIALKAGVMNLLSIGAAYGVVALVAEGGWAGQLVGIDTELPVPPFIPVMMFAILFGLSMDYEVFLLSRMREEFLGHGENSRAVTEGLAKTARVITAAAAIMVVVFLSFVLSADIVPRLVGVGLATAIFVDATIVRMVLVPAVMQLLGRANWWTPPWLDRTLPRLDAEPARAGG